jgi:hypothetical protein
MVNNFVIDRKIKFLSDKLNSLVITGHRKENAIWSATILNLTFYSYIFGLIIDNKIDIDVRYMIIFCTLITFAFGFFIFSSFGALRDSVVSSNTLNQGISKIIDGENLDIKCELNWQIPISLQKDYEDIREKVNKYHNKCRPIKITWYTFWFFVSSVIIIPILNKRLRNFFLRNKLESTHDRQEGVIYFLLLTFLIAFVLVLIFATNEVPDNQLICLTDSIVLHMNC